MNKNILLLLLSLSASQLFGQEPKLMLPLGHSLGVATAVFSPDGKRIVTSSLDNKVKIWEVNSGTLLANLLGHTDTVVTANYSPDGKIIVTAAEDGLVKLWDANTAISLRDLKGHTNKVYMAEFSPDGKKIVTASEDKTARIWDVETGQLLFNLTGHTKAIYPARFSPDGKKVITGSNDGDAKVWDASSGYLLVVLKGHSQEIWSAEFSPDGKRIITSSMDSTVKVWDAFTGNILFHKSEHKDGVRFAEFSPDGKTFLSGSDDGTVKIWNAQTGNRLFELVGKKKEPGDKFANYYPDVVMAAHFSPDGKKILTAYLDSSVKIWDAITGKLLLNIKRAYEYTNSGGFSADGKKIALALALAHAEIWDITTGQIIADLKGKVNTIQPPRLSKDGKRLLISAVEGPAKLLDANTGQLIATFYCGDPAGQFIWASFSQDEKKILVTSYTCNTPRVYDAITGLLLFELKGHTEGAFGGFSWNNRKITTSSSRDSTARVWDAATGKLLTTFRGNRPDAFSYMQSDTVRKKLYSIPRTEGKVYVWNAENGLLEKEIDAHKKSISNIFVSAKQNKLLTTSEDSTAKIWDLETGKLLYTLKEPGRRIRYGHFSGDGSKIFLTLSERINGTIITKIWDTETGNYIAQLDMEGAAPDFNVALSADGKKAYSGMGDGSFKIWDASTGTLLKNFKSLKPTVNASIHQFTPDDKQIITSTDEGEIKFYDAETGTLARELKGHGFKIATIQFSPDGKKIFTSSWDNSIKIWDNETGKELFTFLTIGAEDYLILDKDNHFDGSEGARKQLYFTCGTEVIELDQLKDQLWVPNLSERILNGEVINAAKLSDLNVCNLTPIVDTIEQSALQYRFRITPREGGLGATILYLNGIEIKRFLPSQLQKQNTNYLLAVDKKELQKLFVSNKQNVINVRALTAKHSISSRSAYINEKKLEKLVTLPNLYAIMVGVSDYKGDELDLKFASKDATDMANAIDISAKKLLNTDGKNHVYVYKVHTSQGRDIFPEKNSIRQILSDISARAQPNDILMIFFAGHGVVEADKNQFYFLTADASGATVSGALKNVGISTDELAEWIKPQVMKAQKRILIFDACNSGQAIKEMISFNKDVKNLLASRGDDNGKQIKVIEKLNEKSGMFILAASASDQKAYEIGKYNQGALTYSLLKAIKEEPDILEDRQYLNISRWFNAAEKTVTALAKETGTRQQPQLVSTSNFNIGLVDDEVRGKVILPFEKLLFTRSEFRNTESRLDNLRLRNLLDKKLSELSETENSFLYNPEYEGSNIYSINGDYLIKGNDATVSILLIKGGTEVMSRYEVTGDVNKPDMLADQITTKIVEWVRLRK